MLLNEIKTLEEVEKTLRCNLMLPALADKLRYVIDALIQPQGEPVGYIDAEQLRRWDVLRGTEFEVEERCYMPFSKVPFKTDMTDCSLPIYTTPPSVEAAIEATKDKAAKLCEERDDAYGTFTAGDCAAAIRSMK